MYYRCTRAAVLLAACLLILTIGPGTSSSQEETPKKEQRPAAPNQENIEDLEEFIDKLVKQALDRAFQNPNLPRGPGRQVGRLARGNSPAEQRLGATMEPVSPALEDQLSLPKGQGLVISAVRPDSAAAKAGLRASDILLEINGKPVSNELQGFARQLQDIKANTPVDAVVLRKGKKETIKDLSLPAVQNDAANPNVPLLRGNLGGINLGNLGFHNLRGLPAGPEAALQLGGQPGQPVATARGSDRFIAAFQEGGLRITVTGQVVEGAAKVAEIMIQDGETTSKYDDVTKVPAALRDKVNYVIQENEKTNRRIDGK
jgi:membrane-associated protease RseP (regulator of RpoE activity)